LLLPRLAVASLVVAAIATPCASMTGLSTRTGRPTGAGANSLPVWEWATSRAGHGRTVQCRGDRKQRQHATDYAPSAPEVPDARSSGTSTTVAAKPEDSPTSARNPVSRPKTEVPGVKVSASSRGGAVDPEVFRGILTRLRADLGAAEDSIKRANLSAGQLRMLTARADALAAGIEDSAEKMSPDFRAVLPFNDLHARILALHAPLQRARGLPPLTIWATNRWDTLQPTETPANPPSIPRLSVESMLNEYRSATLNLTNTTDDPVRVALSVTGLPGGTNPGYVSVREVLFTDTREHIVVADALPNAARSDGAFIVQIPAGMTRQVWLEFRPIGIKPGNYLGDVRIRVVGVGRTTLVPLAFHVHPHTFPAMPTIHVGGWDYLEGGGMYEANPANIPQFLRLLRVNYIDTPWSGAAVMPAGATFDRDGRLTNAMDFSRWDRWVASWPWARLYAVFLNVGDGFSGEKTGTARFSQMLGSWLNAWAEHMRRQGLQAEQLVLLLSDEPSEHSRSQTDLVRTWAQAIKASGSRATLFEDPTYARPQDVERGFWSDVDILCPNLPMFMAADDAFRSFYALQQRSGRALWYYSCSGPARLLDPVAYYRGQFWWAARYGASGSLFWAFGDEAGSSSWNPYSQKRSAYSPLFIAPAEVTDSKHMAAIREGAQDYEYFVMLRGRVAELDQRGITGQLLDRARQMAAHGADDVLAQINIASLQWNASKNRDSMDRVRIQILELLDGLAGLAPRK
jgi:hypothetical protein